MFRYSRASLNQCGCFHRLARRHIPSALLLGTRLHTIQSIKFNPNALEQFGDEFAPAEVGADGQSSKVLCLTVRLATY